MVKGKSPEAKPDFVRGLCDSGRVTADMAVKAVGVDTRLFSELIQLSFSQPYPICMRTARVAELCCEVHPWLIVPHLDEIMAKLPTVKVDGVKRSYLKVINDHLGPEKIKDPGVLVQLCYDWLVSPSESVAVRYHCLGILDRISILLPELRPELKTVLDFLKEEGSLSPGLQSRIRKIR